MKISSAVHRIVVLKCDIKQTAPKDWQKCRQCAKILGLGSRFQKVEKYFLWFLLICATISSPLSAFSSMKIHIQRTQKKGSRRLLNSYINHNFTQSTSRSISDQRKSQQKAPPELIFSHFKRRTVSWRRKQSSISPPPLHLFN